ncbi:MAG: dihydrofolate reductase [Pirellulaceae bacterium]
MIKLVVVTDSDHCIGSPGEGANWYQQLPANVVDGIKSAYLAADQIAISRQCFSELVPVAAKGFWLSASNADRPAAVSKKLKACADLNEVVRKHISSGDELVVAGGATLFRSFLPHAAVIDLFVVDSPLNGEIIFSDWNDGSFDVVDEMEKDGYKIQRMFRV